MEKKITCLEDKIVSSRIAINGKPSEKDLTNYCVDSRYCSYKRNRMFKNYCMLFNNNGTTEYELTTSLMMDYY